MKSLLTSAVVVVAIVSASCSRPAAQQGQGGFAVPVSAAPIVRGDITTTFKVTGSVTPLQQAALSSVISGDVLSVGPQIGQHVRAGELVVKIDDSTLRAQLQQNQAALQAAQARLASTLASSSGNLSSTNASLQSARVADQTAQLNLRRNLDLFRQGYVSQSALDQARQEAASADAALRAAEVAAQNAALNPSAPSAAAADVRNAEAAVAQARASVDFVAAQIAQTNVTAPFSGVVTARHVDPGALAAPGTSLLDVAQLDHVFVDVGIPNGSLSYVHVGMPVSVTIGSTQARVWHGTVQYLSRSSVPGTLTYQARIPIANSDLGLHGGEVATVSLPQAHKSGVLLVPPSAVFQTDAGYAMFIIDSGKAKSVPVEVGLANDQQVEVSGPGLKSGVQAILNHAATLQPGMPVQALPPQSQSHY